MAALSAEARRKIKKKRDAKWLIPTPFGILGNQQPADSITLFGGFSPIRLRWCGLGSGVPATRLFALNVVQLTGDVGTNRLGFRRNCWVIRYEMNFTLTQQNSAA